MNKKSANTKKLQDVLNEILMAVESPTYAVFEEYINKYPQFERELLEFVTTWLAEESLPEALPLSAEKEEIMITRAMSRVENLLYKVNKEDTPPKEIKASATPLASLIQSARSAGFDPGVFATKCHINRGLLVKLDARQISFSSIPAHLIEVFAQTLNRSTQDIVEFLEQPSRIIPGASFLSSGTPQVSSQETFNEAVQKSTLSQALKDYWTSELPPINYPIGRNSSGKL
jgi:hypothetical protein